MEYLIVNLICGVIATAIAAHKGRNMIGWFFGGFFLGVIGIVIVACVSNLKEDKARRERVEQEQHRLRERLRQEQMKNEAFRGYAAARLDGHDRALGVDTRTQPALSAGTARPLGLGADPPAAPGHWPVGAGASTPPPPPVPGADNRTWYYELNGKVQGPVSEVALKMFLRSSTGRITRSTLVWTEGLTEWTPVDRVESLRGEARP